MLSIIIVNYKTSRDILKCLESLVIYEKKYKAYEIIIVDNNSDDPGLTDISKSFPFVKIIYAPKNGGFAYGNNIGIKNSAGDYIFLLNPDTYLIDNSIEKLYNRLANDTKAHIIGPQLLYPDRSNQSYGAPKSYLTLWKLFCEQFYLYKIFQNSKLFNSYFKTYMDYNKETEVEQVSGAALMFKKSILDSIGLLDENYFMYFEESDFCLQAVRNHMHLFYFPQSKIVHTHAAGLFSERSIRDFVTSFKYYFKKNFHSICYYPAISILAFGSIIRLIGYTVFMDKKREAYKLYLKFIFKI